MEATFAAIREAIGTAQIPPDQAQTSLWCLEQLPRLYQNLAETHDHRHLEGIQGHIQNILKTADSPKLAESICTLLQETHERLGLPNLTLKVAAPPKRKAAPRQRIIRRVD
jgi:hypothetical protein